MTESPRRHRVPIAATLLLLAAALPAQARDLDFATSFEQAEPVPAQAQPAAVRIAVGDGPQRPYAAKAKMGYSGQRALNYRADAAGSARMFDVDIEVQKDTVLSWMVLPEIVDGHADASTGVSVDLLFDDGRRLSQLGLMDQHGAAANAAGQAASKTLYPQQWAHKQVRVGDLVALRGKHIRAIELQVQPGQDAAASGWIDDIAVRRQAQPRIDRPSDYVVTTRGTQSNGTFSRGNNIPATAMPHGFNFWVPVTDAGSLGWLYRWSEQNGDDNRPRLQALSISHEPSPWMGDRQTFQVMPSSTRGVPEADRGKRALSFSHDHEEARPQAYRVDFDNGIRAEIAPSERAAIFRFRFPQGGDANLLFDNVDARAGLALDAATQTVRGYSDTRSGLSNGATRMFVYARFDRPWRDSGKIESGRATGYVKFAPDPSGEVIMRIATSLLSVEQAQRNLEQEIGDASFDLVRSRAQDAWDALLGRVKVEGASYDQRVTVYSNLYRLFLYPNIAYENTGTAGQPEWRHADQNSWSKDNSGGDDQLTSAAVKPGRIYVNNGFWDTFRTTWPAYALFTPQRAGEMIDGFLQQYRDGGWVARWSSPGYADLMVGTSSDVAFADAWLKGVTGFDAHEAYEAALRNATVVPPVSNVGRKGLARSMYRGYADNSVHEGLSWTLEGAVNDFGLAQMASGLAAAEKDSERARRYAEEAEYFRARATDYVHLFDPATRFFRGRSPDGRWDSPAAGFDPRIWGGDYTEANAWTFAFTVPHDAAGLASLLGGDDVLAQRLDEFFATPETAEQEFAGSYGDIIHEMTEARDVRMGMYAHSNQPSHHIPWMYVAAGQPWKTQRITRDIIGRLYLGSEIGQGYPGDEDNGEMSAWYLFGMLGLYPLRMGAPEYVIGSPAFPYTEVDLRGGRTLTVIARNNNADNVYVQSLKVNGKPWPRPWIRHQDIANGATLEFVMGPAPSAWGSGSDALPPSLTPPGEAPRGLADMTSKALSVSLGGRGRAEALVDDDASTTLPLPADAELEFRFAAPAHVTHYTLTSADAALAGLSWTLEGRSGNGAWTLLDQRRGQAFPSRRQLRPFRVEHPGDYAAYRLRLDAPAAAALAELELLQPVTRQAVP
ncbi:GH92 family glycosyl hydrolase [Pseudoxanthomonas dokdonensis]|uniref:Alpha-1 2-mannosidase n=1 Tax=Pseudoxanthomonas dokdonensis TaxID=344882 RepID=A0A0R0CXP1_9GAMM|nr:GH92 family glycosyl hydrolase [Pseudoxanthomonas dokdonensis]KRG70577.1 alpha-1 2-mannosidase [Pseudoxanthomonas dokdonensis]